MATSAISKPRPHLSKAQLRAKCAQFKHLGPEFCSVLKRLRIVDVNVLYYSLLGCKPISGFWVICPSSRLFVQVEGVGLASDSMSLSVVSWGPEECGFPERARIAQEIRFLDTLIFSIQALIFLHYAVRACLTLWMAMLVDVLVNASFWARLAGDTYINALRGCCGRSLTRRNQPLYPSGEFDGMTGTARGRGIGTSIMLYV